MPNKNNESLFQSEMICYCSPNLLSSLVVVRTMGGCRTPEELIKILWDIDIIRGELKLEGIEKDAFLEAVTEMWGDFEAHHIEQIYELLRNDTPTLLRMAVHQ